MRAKEFIVENIINPQDADLVTALTLLQSKIEDGDLQNDLPTNRVLRYIRNSGISSFTEQDLISANERIPALQSILTNITPNIITFNTTGEEKTASNQPDYQAGIESPQEIVSGMAKKALKRRKD